MKTGETILIVDDMSSNLDILEEFLGKDYDLERADSGKTALAKLEDGLRPDLILLDIVMQGIDGYEVCRRIVKDKRFSEIPVIFLSALSQLDNKTTGFEAGAVDYIPKPFEAAEVLSRVKTHIALKKASHALKEQNIQLKKTMELKESVDKIFQHDLKGPLTAVIGGAQILSGFIEDEELLEIVEGISQAGLQILKMINFSLDLYKMEQGIYRMIPKKVLVSELADSIIRQFRKSRLFSGIDFREINDDAVCKISGEEMLVYSMLMNLVQNGADAARPDGFVEIHVSCSSECVITVRNSGEVPEAIRDSFFDKFVTMGKSNGTGLGTYAVRLICRLHGGEVKADFSEKGHTTVILTLPLL